MPVSKHRADLLVFSLRGLAGTDFESRTIADRIIPELKGLVTRFEPIHAEVGTGVGVAAFGSPVAAARCALVVRDYFRNRAWRNEGFRHDLSAALALHSTSVLVPGDASDVFDAGRGGVFAQRLMEAANDGAVLASETFALQLRQELEAEQDGGLRIHESGEPSDEDRLFGISWRDEAAPAAWTRGASLPTSDTVAGGTPSTEPTASGLPNTAPPATTGESRHDKVPARVVLALVGAFLLVLVVLVSILTFVHERVDGIGLSSVVVGVVLLMIVLLLGVGLLTGRLGEGGFVKVVEKLLDRLGGER